MGMGDQEVLTLAKQLEEAFNVGDWGAYLAGFSDDAVMETPMIRASGRQEILEFVRGVKEAYPDLTATITRQLACGNTVVEELAFEGTHAGPLKTPRGTIPATNRRINFKAVLLMDISNGKVTASHEYYDRAGIMAQLGIGPGAPA